MIRRGSLVGLLVVLWDRLVALATGERRDATCPVTIVRYDRRWVCVRRYGHGGRETDALHVGTHVLVDAGEAPPPEPPTLPPRGGVYEGWASGEPRVEEGWTG